MTWQDILGVRWSWRPRRAVRILVAVAVTLAVVGPMLFVVVCLCLTIGVGWTGLLLSLAVLFVWISEKWWVVFAPDNLLLWLKLLPGIWLWAAEVDDAPFAREVLAADEPVRSNPAISQQHWPTRLS